MLECLFQSVSSYVIESVGVLSVGLSDYNACIEYVQTIADGRRPTACSRSSTYRPGVRHG